MQTSTTPSSTTKTSRKHVVGTFNWIRQEVAVGFNDTGPWKRMQVDVSETSSCLSTCPDSILVAMGHELDRKEDETSGFPLDGPGIFRDETKPVVAEHHNVAAVKAYFSACYLISSSS